MTLQSAALVRLQRQERAGHIGAQSPALCEVVIAFKAAWFCLQSDIRQPLQHALHGLAAAPGPRHELVDRQPERTCLQFQRHIQNFTQLSIRHRQNSPFRFYTPKNDA